ncbi:MAG: phenylacetate--CoA ligase [Deltaproteobacteria bacterium]|nr:phenylacetate--CoA ligase [Deltaproteobacteria bacterium]MBW2019404.1 phenylacetate--CoA ligase [Deltaproteobacteria bacterium]MBW2074241.1 phenylacetate--CoA ligase [Deltaproteobacteria bacterium]RLB83919.1 MAG: phenylacetate--CoA ligase [Deltaproteobacteria bacterium]
MIYDEEFETLPREALEAIQLKRLQQVVEKVYATVPFYKKAFDEKGVKPGDIRALEDLQKLPFTMKQDLRDNYPFAMFATPMENVVRIHASSGTTGKPTVVGYTRRDIDTWSDLMARTLAAAGTHKGDIVHNAYGYGLFTGGLGFHYGAERLGASVIPVSGGNTKRQVMLMKDFGATVLSCTPSYALRLGEVAAEEGVDFKSLKFRIGVCGAEPWSENMRKEIENQLGIDAVDIYGLSEIIGPGVAVECVEAKQGLHIFEDHFIPEIIDPETGEVLPYGEPGELVFTTLTKEAFPLIRYRTRDLSVLYREPCRCGRTLVRMGRVTGRSDDMLIIRGVNVFPSQIESVLMTRKDVAPYYLLIVDRKGHMDTLEVNIEVNENVFSDAVKDLQNMEREIEKDIKDLLGVSCKVRLVEPKTIQRSEGKAKRVIDKRKL